MSSVSLSTASGTGAERVFQRATLPDGMEPADLRLPASLMPGARVEVIVETVARSLADEQSVRRGQGLAELDSEGQRGHIRNVQAAESEVAKMLNDLGGQVVHKFGISFSGLSVTVDADKLSQVTALPGVKAVHRTRIFTPALNNSVPFILGGKTNEGLGVDGSGQVIAIIDTGIDYTHADLGGSGLLADYESNNPTVIEPGTFPTSKVIGGTDLVGEFYDPNCATSGPPPACSNVPTPDADPLDVEGHGSHVAGIAAGIGAGSVPAGVAPAAKLLAIKVFGPGSTSDANIVAAIEFAMDPNRDGDTSDHADVINMSLGSPFGSDFEPSAVAANAAAALGVVVVASAGNSGNIPFITGSPASASDVISVAAANDPGLAIQLVQALGTGGADGMYESVEASFTPPLTGTGTTTGPVQFVGLACSTAGVSPFAAGSLTGSIPLIQRGSCTFGEKVTNVEAGGAIAAVVFNNQPGGAPFAMGASVVAGIPAVMIGNVDGLALRAALLPGTTFVLDPANVTPIPDQLQDFTSTGPRFLDSALKPDVSAPGGSILSVAAGSGTGGVSFSGTSMSSPHVAGVAALLKQLHPTWDSLSIKALLMNTATDNLQPDGSPYPLVRMGAGRVQGDGAGGPEAGVMPPSTAFGTDQLISAGTADFRVEFTLTNHSISGKTFAPVVQLLSASQDGSQVSFDLPQTVTVNAVSSTRLDLQIEVTTAPTSAFGGRQGFLVLRETTAGGDVLRVPFLLESQSLRSAAQASDKNAQVEFRNSGAQGTQVDLYQLGVVDLDEDLILEPTGQPPQPDDWFDIRFTGAHAADSPFGRVVEFAVAVYGRRDVVNPMVTEVILDVDKDGVPDYAVVAVDRGQLLNNAFDGTMISAIFELRSGSGLLQFVLVNQLGASWQTVPFLVDDLNSLGVAFGGPTIDTANPDFDYSVVTTDLLAEVQATDSTDNARFNALVPALDATPQFPFLAPDERLVVDVAGTAQTGSLLALFFNNVSGPAQAAVIAVQRR